MDPENPVRRLSHPMTSHRALPRILPMLGRGPGVGLEDSDKQTHAPADLWRAHAGERATPFRGGDPAFYGRFSEGAHPPMP